MQAYIALKHVAASSGNSLLFALYKDTMATSSMRMEISPVRNACSRYWLWKLVEFSLLRLLKFMLEVLLYPWPWPKNRTRASKLVSRRDTHRAIRNAPVDFSKPSFSVNASDDSRNLSTILEPIVGKKRYRQKNIIIPESASKIIFGI